MLRVPFTNAIKYFLLTYLLTCYVIMPEKWSFPSSSLEYSMSRHRLTEDNPSLDAPSTAATKSLKLLPLSLPLQHIKLLRWRRRTCPSH